MILSFFAIVLLLSSLPLSVCREPLINKHGRFTYVDSVQTVSVEGIGASLESNPFTRRATTPYRYCRGKCKQPRQPDIPRLAKRQPKPKVRVPTRETAKSKPRLSRRQFVYPADNEAMEEYLINRVDNYVTNNALAVYDYSLNPGNSAQFEVLGDEPVEIVLDGLCGCTALLIASRRAVYFAHFFENISFLDSDYANNAAARERFEDIVIRFLDTGDDLMGEVYDEDGDLILREYVALTDNLHFFTPDTNPSIIIVSPVDELEDAVEQGVEVNGVVDYGDGLLYEDYIERLKGYLAEILPGIEPTVFSYEALDNNDPLLDGWRGKGLYQYDPEAEVNPTRRGARFFYQVEDIEDPEDEEGEGYPMGRLYHDYWDPLLFGIGEDRDLDMADYPVQRPDLLVCSGQSYWKPKYNCFANGILCPILDGFRTLPCGADCYFDSQYTCFESKLCPVLEGNATFPCGEDCYLPSEYRCVNSTLTQILPNESPGQSPDQFGQVPVLPTHDLDFVMEGTTYIIGPTPTTIVDGNGVSVTLAPALVVIGTKTVWTGPASLSTSIVVDDLTVTVIPHTTQDASSTGEPSAGTLTSLVPSTSPTPAPTDAGATGGGPGPSTVGGASTFPSPTSGLPGSSSALPSRLESSTVITWTATEGSSSIEITFTPTTLTQFTSLTTLSTITTDVDGDPTTFVVGPGGIAWDPVPTATTTSLPGFPPFPFLTAPPAPVPPSSSTLPPVTSSPSPFPTAFPWPVPTITTVTSTIDDPSGSGPTTTIITGTTNSDGSVVPITTLSTNEAVGSAQALLSELGDVSAAIVAFSSSTANTAKATAALEKVEDAQNDTNDFGSGLSISGPGSGLWSIFGSTVSGISSALGGLLSTISGIISGGGASGSSSLTGPLNDLTSLSDALSADINEAISGTTNPTITAPPPSTSIGSSTRTEPSSCEATQLTNCAVLCATDTNPVTTTCFSTTCTVETVCSGSPATSTAILSHVCPLDRRSDIGKVSKFGGGARPTMTSSQDAGSTTSTTNIITDTTSMSTDTGSETEEPTTSLSTTTSTSTSEPTSTEPPAPPPPETTVPSSTEPSTTTTSDPDPAPTWGGRCSTYEDCPRCPDGYYRCCLSGCHGMLVPGSNTCGCVRDGEVVSPVCGCV
ncbi:hypothetical protein BDW60DRAFT_187759 [Aspergillus nidulans var. acristatus]